METARVKTLRMMGAWDSVDTVRRQLARKYRAELESEVTAIEDGLGRKWDWLESHQDDARCDDREARWISEIRQYEARVDELRIVESFCV